MEKANNNVTMDAFATQLSGSIDIDRTAVNRTGLFWNSREFPDLLFKGRGSLRLSSARPSL